MASLTFTSSFGSLVLNVDGRGALHAGGNAQVEFETNSYLEKPEDSDWVAELKSSWELIPAVEASDAYLPAELVAAWRSEPLRTHAHATHQEGHIFLCMVTPAAGFDRLWNLFVQHLGSTTVTLRVYLPFGGFNGTLGDSIPRAEFESGRSLVTVASFSVVAAGWQPFIPSV